VYIPEGSLRLRMPHWF